MQGNFFVQIEKFAERHFIKGFEKKYKKYWDVTLRAIIAELERIDVFVANTSKAEVICGDDCVKIVKTEFRIAGTKESAKTSGNRCIAAWDIKKSAVSLLLIYGKTDLSGKNETAEWQRIIKENYLEYRNLLR